MKRTMMATLLVMGLVALPLAAQSYPSPNQTDKSSSSSSSSATSGYGTDMDKAATSPSTSDTNINKESSSSSSTSSTDTATTFDKSNLNSSRDVNTKLPRTASPLPLYELAGALSALSAFGMRL